MSESPDLRGGVCVARVTEVWQADVMRAEIEAFGIPALLMDDVYLYWQPLHSFALGGVRIVVPHEYADAAREIIGDGGVVGFGMPFRGLKNCGWQAKTLFAVLFLGPHIAVLTAAVRHALSRWRGWTLPRW